MSPNAIIASTLGWDLREVSEYRYQKYVKPAVYAVGETYLAASATKPTHDVGQPWEPHGDQFWAQRAGTTLWVSKAVTTPKAAP